MAKVIFASSAIILLALAIMLYLQINSLISSFNQINHTNAVRLKLEQILSHLNDAESAQRGYLLSKDSAFLKPYSSAHKKILILQKELDAITQDNEEQQKNLIILQSLIGVRFKAFNAGIQEYHRPNQSSVTQNLFLLRGKESMDEIRQRVNTMVTLEEQLTKVKEQIRDQNSFLTPLIACFLFLASLSVLLFSYAKIIEELNRSKRYLKEVEGLNTELESKNQALELYNKELDSFSYIASHDLKEPLRKIQLFSAKLLADQEQILTERGREDLHRIDLAAQRMQNLLNDLLHYSFYSNNEEVDFTPTSLEFIVQEVRETLSEAISENNAVITTKALPNINGLHFQLKQLFENLILNSIKFRSKDKQPLISIEGSLVKKETIRKSIPAFAPMYHKIVYRDNGIGFEQTFAQKIFTVFQRVHSKDEFEGTGMGLTICKKIVQNHNGFIEAFSSPNNGTAFEIYLPV
jgi:signal transduction histidine kinase